jgi:serine/threonine protein kinase/dipeptidyl aminopeptidase/acylaminoacyl peptidase
MALKAGDRLGPYEILSAIGAGGMGEVFRARDSRLGRDVAIKVLPAELAGDNGRLKRFEKEARSASALNHPNIVTVYDVGTSDGVSWIAMELVGGETLRAILAAGPLPQRKLLTCAAQIAEGLAKAHVTGIVHRDLKPENVMVTKEGLVKILDFGLAKLAEPVESADVAEAPTVSAVTEAGVVLGTIGYMSPEQARGRPLDFRSDQFSFGSILYEMASSKRAFSRASAPETLAAIIRDEPTPITEAAPGTPVSLRWIVERCLAKDPEERYGSTKDLAFDLARVRDGLSEASAPGLTTAALAPPHRTSRGPIIAGAALLAGTALGVLVITMRTSNESPPLYRPVTFQRGSLGIARFAPDGQTILYGAAWQGRPVQLFSTRLDSTESTALPFPGASLLSVSAAGKLAILTRHAGGSSAIAEVPLAGGAPRELVETDPPEALQFAPAVADWRPGDDRLAIVRNGQIEFPLGNVVVPAADGSAVLEARFSPDGRQLAFVQNQGQESAVGVVDLAGHAKILSRGWEFILGLAWHPGTGEIWFSARGRSVTIGVVELHAVSLAGVHRVVARTPQLLIVEDIARDGRVLARSDDWPETMMCLPPGGSKEVDLTWLDFSQSMALSNDGQDLVFLEGGAGGGAKGGVYMRKTDGSGPAVRLGDGWQGVALSADRKWIVQNAVDHLILLPVGPGASRTIQDKDFQYRKAAWFPDGQRLLIAAAAAGHAPRLYVRDLASGPPRPVTPEGISGGHLSLDGRFVTAGDLNNGPLTIYPVDGGAPRPVPGVRPDDAVISFDAKGQSLFLQSGTMPVHIDRLDLASGARSPFRQIAVADPTGVDALATLQLTPDGRSYCYSFMRSLSRLYVVEGLR